jgi:hypothetical protein
MTSPIKKIAGRIAFDVKNRLMSVRLHNNSVVVYVPVDEETGLPQSILQFIKNGGNTGRYVINLSFMTPVELELFEETIITAIALAKPLSKLTDEYVRDHKEELSADFNSRVYRPAPIVVLGKRALSEYSESLFGGYADVLRRAGFIFGNNRRVPVPRGPVVESPESVTSADNVYPEISLGP